MSHEWRLYLDDMIKSGQKVSRFTHDMTQQSFLADERTYDAVVRNLEILGEAAKRIPDDVRQLMSEIEWRKISGMRDWIAHAYFGLDPDILWDVIEHKIPTLIRTLQAFRDANLE